MTHLVKQLTLPGLSYDNIDVVIAQQRHKAHQKNVLKQKILVGAYFLGESRRATYHDLIVECMSSYLTLEKDRALFDLPPLTKDAN